MITLQELNKKGYSTNYMIDGNLQILLMKLNKVRAVYGLPMVVTSGLRTEQQQQELITQGKSNAPHSKHLTGEAADILDSDGSLKKWVLENVQLMEDVGLWMEDFSSTPTWVHFQISAPRSGNRFFIP